MPHAAEAADNKWQLQLFVWFLINAFAQCLSNYAFGAMPPQQRWQLAIGNPPRQPATATAATTTTTTRGASAAAAAAASARFILQDRNNSYVDVDDHRMAIRHRQYLMHY